MTDPTPPPWLIEIGSGGYLAVTDKDGNVIARLDEDEYANAYLISAVHELRAACQSWLDYFEELESLSDPNDPMRGVRSLYHGGRLLLTHDAVAKSRGETP